MSARRGIAVGAAVAALAVVTTVVVVVAGAESAPSAAEALGRARRFVEDAESVRYRGESRFEYHDPEFPEDNGTDESTFEDAAVFPDRSQSVVEYEDFVSETLAIDDVSYSRDAERRSALDEEQWTRFDPEEEEVADEEFPFPPVIGGLLVAPADVPRLLAETGRPRLLAQDNEQSIIRTGIDTDGFDEIYYTNLRADIVVEHDGRIREVRLFAHDEYETVRVRAVFERWNRDVSIEEPDTADIDPTPNVDEEDVAAYDDAALYQPRAIPEGWELSYASVIPEEEGFTDCDQVNVSFSDAEDEEAFGFGYLDLYLMPASCAEGASSSSDPFTAGPYQGWIEEEEGFIIGELTVGDTVISIDTDLSADQVAAILADLVPLDLANPPVATLPLD